MLGRIRFNETSSGEEAMGMVARGEISGISIGYIVDEWEITDSKGRIIDPDVDRVTLDGSLTFTATRFQLLEASLVSVPADSEAIIRSLGAPIGARAARNARARLRMRNRMAGIWL
jgi:phage head maturation protease